MREKAKVTSHLSERRGITLALCRNWHHS